MRALLIGLAFLPAMASAQIYKCTGPDGKVNLTDKPCPTEAAAETITLPPPPETGLQRRQRLEDERLEAERKEHEALISELEKTIKLAKAVSEQQKAQFARRRVQEGLRIGMSFQEVYEHPVWGAPDRVHNTTNANGIRSQWVYPVSVSSEHEVMYLYFVQGVLTAIQN